jgi:hypothetical protein
MKPFSFALMLVVFTATCALGHQRFDSGAIQELHQRRTYAQQQGNHATL